MGKSKTSRLKDIPKPDPGEAGLAAVRATLSTLLPGVGGVIGEGLTVILGPAVNRRRDKFLHEMEADIKQLQAQHRTMTDQVLAQNQSFVTAAINAGFASLRTHQEDKLKRFRNLVLNAALPEAPEDTLQSWYMQILEMLTEWHLELLAIIDDAKAWLDHRGLAVRHHPLLTEWSLVSSTFMYVGAPDGIYRVCINDLLAAGLIQPGHDRDPDKAKYSLARITALGRQFLGFIASPLAGT